ncbi:MAG: glycoside hydrolase family 3 protein [Lachnospiraceae bacterium]|nr:glycoside hydrolase family 3 protein [Lachnospiraceae bacterium]
MNMRTEKLRVLLTVLLCTLLLCGCASGLPERDEKEASPAQTEETGQSETKKTEELKKESEEISEAGEPDEDREEKAVSEDASTAEEADVNEDPETEEQAMTEEPEEKSPEAAASEDPEVLSVLENMSLEARVAQMFVLLPEQLTGMGQVTEAGDVTRAALESFPVGGLLYNDGSLESYEQTKALLADTQQISRETTGLPMLTFVDEEGGIVTRISGRFPEVPWIESMAAYGARGSEEEAYQTGQVMGSYLADLGFTCDCAPVADVLTNPDNYVIGERSFGSDPELVAGMAAALGKGLESEGVTAVYKHFPGHGGTAEDTHEGYSSLEKTKEELYACDLIPFISAIENGAKIIMAAHITLPNITEEDLPASLSPEILAGLLRGELGYDGLIITDALNMGAVTNQYTSAEAAVMAVRAGADMILMPADPFSAYQAVLDAVYSGEITPERIDESVLRILELKL